MILSLVFLNFINKLLTAYSTTYGTKSIGNCKNVTNIISRYISDRLGTLCYEMRKSLLPDILANRETSLLIAKFPTPNVIRNIINEMEGNPIGESKIMILKNEES